MALCLAQLCSAVPISPAQRVWGMSPSLRAAAAAAAALPVQGTVTKCPKHLAELVPERLYLFLCP